MIPVSERDIRSPAAGFSGYGTLPGLTDCRAWLSLMGLFVALIAGPVHAEVNGRALTASQWLEKMSRAGMLYHYAGTFVYRRNGQLMAMNITHVADERGGRQRLAALNGSSREIVRNCDSAICFLPQQKAVIVNKQRNKGHTAANIGERINTLLSHYKVTVGKTDRVAGRTARILNIEPIDDYRYGYRVWIDTETGLLLKSDMINSAGANVEQIMFTDLEIIDQPTPEMLKLVDNQRLMRAGKSGRKVASFNDISTERDKQWRVASIPQGFMRIDHYQHRIAEQGMPVEHMIFSDGLASVSVFIEKKPSDKSLLSGFSTMGAVNVYGAVVADHHVTVVGEVPTETVRLIGESVHYQADANQ